MIFDTRSIFNQNTGYCKMCASFLECARPFSERYLLCQHLLGFCVMVWMIQPFGMVDTIFYEQSIQVNSDTYVHNTNFCFTSIDCNWSKSFQFQWKTSTSSSTFEWYSNSKDRTSYRTNVGWSNGVCVQGNIIYRSNFNDISVVWKFFKNQSRSIDHISYEWRIKNKPKYLARRYKNKRFWNN